MKTISANKVACARRQRKNSNNNQQLVLNGTRNKKLRFVEARKLNCPAFRRAEMCMHPPVFHITKKRDSRLRIPLFFPARGGRPSCFVLEIVFVKKTKPKDRTDRSESVGAEACGVEVVPLSALQVVEVNHVRLALVVAQHLRGTCVRGV